jgi:hypothetical protein
MVNTLGIVHEGLVEQIPKLPGPRPVGFSPTPFLTQPCPLALVLGKGAAVVVRRKKTETSTLSQRRNTKRAEPSVHVPAYLSGDKSDL